MKYITPALKGKLFGSLGLSYVIEGEDGHNQQKQEDGSFQPNNQKLICAEIIPQNDLIEIDFMAGHGEESSLTMNSDELRAFAEELTTWADIMDETYPN